MLTVLALTSLVHASEVATTKKFGIGVASGPFAVSATGKYYLSEKSGIAAYLGSSFNYHGGRFNFESEFVEFGDWEFARLDMYWDAGIDAGIWTYMGTTAYQLGVGGGVGVELQFNKVPASVFVDVGIGIYPVNLKTTYGPTAGFGWVSPRGAAGGRWYF